jgi:hypothetical protein
MVAMAMTALSAGAQVSKTVAGETLVATATVEAIERGSRQVTVKKTDGTYEELYIPQDLKRFDTLKVGDKITARYYENLVLRLKAPGEKDVDAASSSVVPTKDAPSGTAAHQTTITATIAAIDQAVPSISFTGPRGWTYSTRVKDKAALAKVKVGDKVDITWTDALVVSLEQGR